MELILINPGKLKIMLTCEEMKKYELDTDNIDYDTTATRKAFWSILDDARSETGFDAASDRVFIQLYPSKKGGCEMYVTKLGETTPPLRGAGGGSKKARVASSGRGEDRGRLGAFAFDNMEALICVCRRLLAIRWRGESRAYRDQRGKCFLFLSNIFQCAYSPLDELSFISEYGTREDADRLRLYISEYAKCICESGAVQMLGNL